MSTQSEGRARPLTQEERYMLDHIAIAAYAGSAERKPEDDVRWLLWLVGELTGRQSD